MIFIVNLVLFPYEILFAFEKMPEDIISYIYGKGLTLTQDEIESISGGRNRSIQLLNNQVVVKLQYLPNTPKTQGILSHEIFHSVEFILSKMGISLNQETDEVYAYTIEYVTSCVYEKINEATNPTNT